MQYSAARDRLENIASDFLRSASGHMDGARASGAALSARLENQRSNGVTDMEHQKPSWIAEPPQLVTFDPLLPAAVAARAEQGGVKKASTDILTLLVLAVLAGAFISFGAVFATTVGAGSISIADQNGTVQLSTNLPYGVTKLLVGLSFSVGLILVMVGGAELFTGNTMIVMAWANRKVSTRHLLLNWLSVFCGNFAV